MMIEINLLPDGLRAKVRSKNTPEARKPKNFIYLLPLAAVGIIGIHLYLAISTIYKNNGLRALNNRWRILESQKKDLEVFSRDSAMLSDDASAVKKVFQNRIAWAPKLNKLSLLLPSGIWFNEIGLDQTGFTLRGSVVSLEIEEMDLIKKFMDSLKADPIFFKDFSNLELSSVEKKTIGSYEVSDFSLTGKLKK